MSVGNTPETKKEKRQYPRFTPHENVLVIEDTGTKKKFYYLKDISKGGMYLFKKIADQDEQNSRSVFSFQIPGVHKIKIEGVIYQTRLHGNETYGTAIRFINPEDPNIQKIIDAIKDYKKEKIIN